VADRAIPVVAGSPFRADAVRVLTANGDIAADRQVTVFSAVPGRVVERTVNLASAVRDSQIIITVDHSALDLAVDQTRAALSGAQESAANLATELVRVQRLFAERGTSQQQLDAIRTQKNAADRGPGVPVAVVVDLDPLIARVQIPERDLGAIYSSQPTTLTVAAYGDAVFQGKVRRISPVIDPMTRMAEVEILLSNPEGRLLPGMFARLSIEVDRRRGALMVPSDAVLQESRLSAESIGGAERVHYMFVKRGDRAVRRNVTLGYVTGDKVEIRSGIAATDSIIVRGHNLLQDGQAVVVPSSQPAS
jgi:multidrug efflux pump subunit AcrA (membrane-fusion protein)